MYVLLEYFRIFINSQHSHITKIYIYVNRIRYTLRTQVQKILPNLCHIVIVFSCLHSKHIYTIISYLKLIFANI